MSAGEWTRDKWRAGNWCAYCASASTMEDSFHRLYVECPEEYKEAVLSHLQTVWRLKDKAASKKKRR